MTCTTIQLLAFALLVLWLFAPIAILQYRIVSVPKRYREIVERFLQPPAPDAMVGNSHDRDKSGAWHYARLFDPDAQPSNSEDSIKRQFFYFHGWSRYILPYALIIILSGIMMAFSGLWLADAIGSSGPSQTTLVGSNAAVTNATAATSEAGKLPSEGSTKSPLGDHLSTRVKSTFLLALWGAFVWSLYEILNRRNTGDLSPVELYDVAFRFASAIPIGYAFSLLALDTVPGLLAFGISAFPIRDVQQMLRKQALQKLGETPQAASAFASKGYLSEMMSGMGNNTIARLQELNIETYLDLAYTDPIRLMIKTGVPIQLVLSWADQALLGVYAAPYKPKFEQLGMPGALDLCEFYARHCFDVASGQEKDWANNPAVKDLASALSTKDVVLPPELLVHQLLRGVFDDPHSQFLIRVWNGPAKTPHTM